MIPPQLSAPPAFSHEKDTRFTFGQSSAPPGGCDGGGTHTYTNSTNPDGSSNIYVHHISHGTRVAQPQQPQMQMPQMMGIPYPMPTPSYAPLYPYPPPPSSYGCQHQQQQQQPRVVIMTADKPKKDKKDKKTDNEDNKNDGGDGGGGGDEDGGGGGGGEGGGGGGGDASDGDGKETTEDEGPTKQKFSKYSILSVIIFTISLVFGTACIVQTYQVFDSGQETLAQQNGATWQETLANQMSATYYGEINDEIYNDFYDQQCPEQYDASNAYEIGMKVTSEDQVYECFEDPCGEGGWTVVGLCKDDVTLPVSATSQPSDNIDNAVASTDRKIALSLGIISTICFTVATLLDFYTGQQYKAKSKGEDHCCLNTFLIAAWILFCLTFINDLIILALAFDPNNIM